MPKASSALHDHSNGRRHVRDKRACCRRSANDHRRCDLFVERRKRGTRIRRIAKSRVAEDERTQRPPSDATGEINFHRPIYIDRPPVRRGCVTVSYNAARCITITFFKIFFSLIFLTEGVYLINRSDDDRVSLV